MNYQEIYTFIIQFCLLTGSFYLIAGIITWLVGKSKDKKGLKLAGIAIIASAIQIAIIMAIVMHMSVTEMLENS